MIKDIMNKNVKTVTSETLVKDVISIMDKYGYKEIPIIDKEKKILGIVSYLNILNIHRFRGDVKISKFMETTPIINELDDENYLLNVMVNNGITGIPVVNNQENIVGFVSEYDLLKHYKKQKFFDKKLVMDINIKKIPSLKKTDNISTAKNLMNFNRVNRLPIVDKNDKLIGTILSIDLLRTFFKTPEKIKQGSIIQDSSKIMNSSIKGLIRKNIYVTYDSSLNQAIDKMIKNNVLGIVVVNDLNEPLGILDRYHILRKVKKVIGKHDLNIQISGNLTKEHITNIKKIVKDNLKLLQGYKSKINNIKIIIKKIHNNKDHGKVEIHFNIEKEGKEIRIRRTDFDLFLTIMEIVDIANKLLKKEYLDKFKK